MSLEDKFYPDEDKLLTKIDNALIRSAGKVGEAYQHVTGKSYKDLVQGAFSLSANIALVGTLGNPICYLLHMIHKIGKRTLTYQTPLEEEIEYEALGHSRNFGKIARLSAGLVIPFLSHGMYNPNAKGFLVPFMWGAIVGCSSAYPALFGKYLSLSHIPEPPEKTVFTRAKEYLEDLLAPKPLPQLAKTIDI